LFSHEWDGSSYGKLFSALDQQNVKEVTVVHGGPNNDGYDPQFRFYKLLWEDRGLTIKDAGASLPEAPRPSDLVGTCDPNYLPLMREGTVKATVEGCAAVSEFRVPAANSSN
jgi:hypothetical protein